MKWCTCQSLGRSWSWTILPVVLMVAAGRPGGFFVGGDIRIFDKISTLPCQFQSAVRIKTPPVVFGIRLDGIGVKMSTFILFTLLLPVGMSSSFETNGGKMEKNE